MTQGHRALGAAAVALVVSAVPAPAEAHGIVGRADLPIPAEVFAAAAAAVLALSFLALAGGWSRPHLQTWRERPLIRLGRPFEVLAGLLGVVALVMVVYAGFAGTGSQQDNLAPTAVYVVFWVGVPFVSLLLGDVFRLLSPWRATGRLVGVLARRIGGDSLPEPLPYPKRLGYWPAVCGLVAFGVCELCWATGREPAPIAVLALAYTAVQFVGMSLYGVEQWTRRGDAFGVYFSLFARIAPVGRRPDGTVMLRPPVVAAAALPEGRGAVALLVVAIATTAFDGAKEGPVFSEVAPSLQDFFVDLGAGKGLALEAAFLVGYAATILLVSVVWWTAVEGMPRMRARLTRRELADGFTHSLIPILAAYVVAHYFSLVTYNGQDAYRLASDPLGTGADLFGTATRTIDYGVVSATGIWYVQVVALVVGHVVALVLGHDRALALYGSSRAAARSQVVMLMVMISFTCMGLYLLSAANA